MDDRPQQYRVRLVVLLSTLFRFDEFLLDVRRR